MEVWNWGSVTGLVIFLKVKELPTDDQTQYQFSEFPFTMKPTSRRLTLLLSLDFSFSIIVSKGFPGGSAVKSACSAGDVGSIPGSRRSPGEGNGNPPPPIFLPGKSHGHRSLVGYSPGGHKESDMTEGLNNNINSCEQTWAHYLTFVILSFIICKERLKWMITKVFSPADLRNIRN